MKSKPPRRAKWVRVPQESPGTGRFVSTPSALVRLARAAGLHPRYKAHWFVIDWLRRRGFEIEPGPQLLYVYPPSRKG